MREKSSSLLAAVSALGLSLGVTPAAQAQSADDMAGGGRKGGQTQLPITVKPGGACPTGLIDERKPAGATGFINEQGAESVQSKQDADVQSWSWGASNSGSAQMKQTNQLKQSGGAEAAQLKRPGGAVSVQNKVAGGVEMAQSKHAC